MPWMLEQHRFELLGSTYMWGFLVGVFFFNFYRYSITVVCLFSPLHVGFFK